MNAPDGRSDLSDLWGLALESATVLVDELDARGLLEDVRSRRRCRYARTMAHLLRFDVLQSDSASSAQAVPGLFNAPEETWIMFETVVEPVFF